MAELCSSQINIHMNIHIHEYYDYICKSEPQHLRMALRQDFKELVKAKLVHESGTYLTDVLIRGNWDTDTYKGKRI